MIVYKMSANGGFILQTYLVQKNAVVGDGNLSAQDFAIFGLGEYRYLPIKENQAIIGGLSSNSFYNESVSKIVKDDNAIQHFLFVTSGTLNVSEGVKQRNFKKESCLLLQKNKEYTLSQVGDEMMNVYEFKSVKKATTD